MLRPRVIRAAIVGVFLLLLVNAVRSGCDHDEVEHLHSAWLVGQGARPYLDFVQMHHPTVFYLFAPLATALSDAPRALVVAARIIQLGLLALALLVFSAIAAPLAADRRASWSPLLLLGCFFFARNSMEIRNDPWMTALVLLALWAWTAYLRGGEMGRAALAGLAFGSAVVFSQKAALLAVLVPIGTAIALARDRAAWARVARGTALAAACAGVPLAAMALFIHRAGYFREFLFWNYSFVKYLYLSDPRHLGPAALATLGVSVGEAPVLWLAGLAGIALAVRQRRPETTIAAVVLLGLAASLLRSRWPWGHNLLLLQVCLAILAVPVVDRALASERWQTAAASLLLLVVAKTAVLSSFYTEVPDAPRVQEATLAATAPTDRVAMPPPYHPIVRRDAFFFWLAPQIFVPAYLDCCNRGPCPQGKAAADARAWIEAPPKAVFAPAGEPTWTARGWAEHQSEYRETAIPGLWLRDAAGSPRSVAGAAAP